MIKHLRLIHKEQEHIWNDSNFIAQLKRDTSAPADGFIQSESSNTNESSNLTDERNNVQPKRTSTNIGSMDNGNL